MEYFKPFMIGGTIIALSKYVSQFMNPAIGSLVGGMPTGILASLFLETISEKKEFYEGYSIHAPILALIIVIISLLIQYTRYNINVISIVGMMLWFVVSYIVLQKIIINKKE